MTVLSFTKMHGLGNDFIVLDATQHALLIPHQNIPLLAHRQLGIGCDQILILEPSQQATFFCRIFNADGSEAEQCGNGLRCVARFIHENRLHDADTLTLETKAGIFSVVIKDYDHIQVSMGIPVLKEKQVKINSLFFAILSMGNPHAITRVDDASATPVDVLSTEISKSPYFPDGINIGFMQVLGLDHIRLRTYERGAGETFACGSNACAAVVAGMINGWLTESVKVDYRFGQLSVEWMGEGQPVYLTGPAVSVFRGSLEVG